MTDVQRTRNLDDQERPDGIARLVEVEWCWVHASMTIWGQSAKAGRYCHLWTGRNGECRIRPRWIEAER